MHSKGISAWASKTGQDVVVLSHLCGWRGEKDSNSRCRECGRQFQSEGPIYAKLVPRSIAARNIRMRGII